MKNDPKKLHQEFVRLGGLRHKLKNKMLAILPEIYESGIWKKYAGSIVEYAGKYGDIARTTVIKRLRLEENLDGLPFLKAAIEKVGVHKVAMLAKIATPETDEALAENALNMSKLAVQSLSKELRTGREEGDQIIEPLPCKAVSITKKIELDEESTFLFMKLKAKLGKNLTDKEFLKLMLEERERQEFPQKIAERSETTIVHGSEGDTKNVTGDRNSRIKFSLSKISISDYMLTKPTTRYVHIAKKRAAIAQTNGKCAYPNCNSLYEVLHHTNRYSESKNHDSIVPLCKIHHEFTHNNLIENETINTDAWRLEVIGESKPEASRADILYKKYRQGAFI